MSKPEYLTKYKFDWEMLDVVIGGKSALDAEHFFGNGIDKNGVDLFLRGYGINGKDPISKAELFGNFQESVQFIKRYFLIEGNKENGLDFKIPNSILMVTDVNELFEKATQDINVLDREWAEIVLKVMHTILHIDKDLRSKYFSTIQTQILDNYYRYIQRDSNNNLLLGNGSEAIPLIEIDTKTKKTRDSVILKLLHKAEHVAEELFDRVGVRFVTHNKLDCIRVVEFLIEKGVVIPHNIKPSRSINNLINLEHLKNNYYSTLKLAMKNNLNEGRFIQALERELNVDIESIKKTRNDFSLDSYKSIQITARQLIRYEDPFLSEFIKLKKFINNASPNEEIKKRLNNLDLSSLARDIEFFYPYEIQVVDDATNINNKKGDASHKEYKKVQLISARDRLFKKLNLMKNIY